MRHRLVLGLLGGLALAGCSADGTTPPVESETPLAPATSTPVDSAPSPSTSFAGHGVVAREPDPREKHFRNLRQLTFEGENAEAYWSFDGTRLVFQHRGDGVPADQIYTIRADGTGLTRASTGTGRTTCAFFLPGDRRVLFASTHLGSATPPPPPDRAAGYVWPVYPDYEIFAADLDGGNLERLTDSPGYDAEAVLSPDGSRVVFTSARDGDLDLYTMKPDGADVRRVTDTPGYDGGAFFSPDSKGLVYRAHHPADEAGVAAFRELLARHLVRPSVMEICISNADGSNRVQVTSNGKANFAPYYHPDGKRILFASNMGDPRGREFDIYIIGIDGTGLEQVTFSGDFDGFPMFSPDGRTLAFCSNRHGAKPGETNVFLADWVE